MKNYKFKCFVFFILYFLVLNFCRGQEFLYDFKILNIIDGDTVTIEANFLPEPLKKELKLRIVNIDTPEKNHLAKCESEVKLAKAATNFLKDVIKNGKEVKIKLEKWDKYGGRVLGDILIDGKLASEQMILNGFAKEYHGAKKTSWCQK